MKPIPTLIVLADKCHSAVSRLLLSLALVLGLAQPGIAAAQSQAAAPQAKIARDLASGLADTGKVKASWMRDLNGARHVQAVIVSNSADPAMTDLRVSNGVVSMSKNDHLGLDQRARVVVKVEGNKWKLD